MKQLDKVQLNPEATFFKKTLKCTILCTVMINSLLEENC